MRVGFHVSAHVICVTHFISFYVKNGLDGTTFEMTVCEKMLAVTLDNFEIKRGRAFWLHC